MKINAALAKSLLLVVSTSLVVPLLAKPPAKPAPAKQEETAKSEGDEAVPTIPGTEVARKDGTYLGITIENACFKIAFYDEKKKQIDCPVARAAARWKPNYTVVEEHCTLNPSGDGKTLISPTVRPPYNFKLFLTLLSEDGQAVESFGNIGFRG